jgi:hypothetical protein
MYGGCTADAVFCSDSFDTWIWDGRNKNWFQAGTATHPPDAYGAMAWNEDSEQVLFFDRNGTTWGFDGINWSQKTPVTSPAPRFDEKWASTRGANLMFGGYLTTTPQALAETWSWVTPYLGTGLVPVNATATRSGGNYTVTMSLQNTGGVPDTSIVLTSAALGGAGGKKLGTASLTANAQTTVDVSATFAVKSVSNPIPGVPVVVIFTGTYSANGVSGVPWVGSFAIPLP